MSLDAPAPCLLRRRRAEHGEEILLRVALEPRRRLSLRARRFDDALRGLERAEHGLEIHDLRRRHVAALAEAALQQLVRELALRLAHRADQQPLAREHFG